MYNSQIQGAIETIRRVAPQIEIKGLEALIERNPNQNADDPNIVIRLFANGLNLITNKYPNLQEKYYGIALYYFEKYKLSTDQNDPGFKPLRIASGLCEISNLLLVELAKRYEDEVSFEDIVSGIMEFYAQNKDKIDVLCKWSDVLIDFYDCILREGEIIDVEKEGHDASFLRTLYDEDPFFYEDPETVRKIWSHIKEEMKKAIQ